MVTKQTEKPAPQEYNSNVRVCPYCEDAIDSAGRCLCVARAGKGWMKR
jgi:hypothetical protein